MIQLIEFILKFDDRLGEMLKAFGPWTYAYYSQLCFAKQV